MGGVERHVLVSQRVVGGRVVYMPAVNIILPSVNVPDSIRKAARGLSATALAELRVSYSTH